MDICKKNKFLFVLILSFLCTSCKMEPNEEKADAENGSLSCNPAESINQKKVRRLSQAQIEKIVTRTYRNAYSARQFDYQAFFVPVSHLGYSLDSEKISVDQLALSRWAKSIVARQHTFVWMARPGNGCDNVNDFAQNSCLDQEIDKYSKLLLRRPIKETERSDIKNALEVIRASGANYEEQLAFLHKYFLLHPTFFYRTEVNLQNGELSEVTQLDQFEIASFLSYSIIDDAPDETLYQKAEQGLLKNKDVLHAEVERLIKSPEAKSTLKSFLKDLLKVNTVAEQSTGRFGKYTYNRKYSIPSPAGWNNQSFRVQGRFLSGEVDSFIDQRLGEDLNYMDVFSGNSFPVSNRTFAIYNNDPSVVSSVFAEAQPDESNMHYLYTTNYETPAEERSGILSHPAYLVVHSGDNEKGMVKRGVFFLEQLLCHEMPAAPADIQPKDELPSGFDPTQLTTRRKFELLHSDQPACFFCHKTIDNIGGSFESFDNTGLFELTETFEVNGSSYTLDIDSSGELNGIEEMNIKYSDSVDFIKKVTQTKEFKACLNRRFLEYINGESKNQNNSCSYEAHTKKILKKEKPAFQDTLLNVVDSVNFLRRSTLSKGDE